MGSLRIVADTLVTIGFWDVSLVILIWVASYIVGLEVLIRIKAVVEPGAERLAIASSLGLIFFSYLTFLLGIIGAFYQTICFLIVLSIILLRIRHLKLFLEEIKSGVKTLSGNLGYVLVFVYSGITLAVVLISALGPAFEYDDIFYHLYSGRMMSLAHRTVSLTDNPYACMPRNIEMLFAFGLILHNEVTAKLIHFLTGILCLLLSYSLAKRIHSKLAGYMAVLILVGTPFFIWEMRTAHIDVALSLFVFLALYGIIRYFAQQHISWLLLSGISICFASGIKYLVFNSIAAFAVTSFVTFFQTDHNWLSSFKKTFLLLVAVIIGLAPWAILNYKEMGDPLFPLLDRFFDSPHWNPRAMQLQLDYLSAIGTPVGVVNPMEHLLFLLRISMRGGEKFHGNIGPLYILILPLIFIVRKIRTENKLLLLFFAVFSVLWLATAQSVRYFLPAVPVLAVLCACAVAEWFQVSIRTNRIIAYSSIAIVGIIAIYSTPFFEPIGSGALHGAKIIDTLPAPVLTGQETKDVYISRHVGNYEALQFFNQIKGQKKLLFWHNTVAASFYTNAPSASVWSSYFYELDTDRSDNLLSILNRYGITHFLCDKIQRHYFLITDPEREFVRKHLIKLFDKNGAVLYQLSTNEIQQPQIYFDFAGHLEKAEYWVPSSHTLRNTSEMVQLVGPVGDRKYAIVLKNHERLGFASQIPPTAFLDFYTGPNICSSKQQQRIIFQLEDGSERIIFEEKSDGSKPYWRQNRINLSDYAGVTVTIIFEGETLDASECSNFVFADPVIAS